jgi:hypothetical protein
MPEFQHINVKIFAREGSTVDWPHLIPVFHRWIREQSFPELLIDVADYAHVPEGPGVMVIGHEAHYSVDNRKNRLGLLYNRRAAFDGSNCDRIAQAYEGALAAARKLEQEPEVGGTLRFDERDVEFGVNDRLLAPNNPEITAEFQKEVAAFLQQRFGDSPALETLSDPRELVRVRTAAASHK